MRDIRDQPFNADAHDCADFVEFIGLAGLGQAEASPLTWRDVDFERGQLTTFRHKTRTGFVIPIYPQVRPLLERPHACRRVEDAGRVLSIKDAKKAITGGACRRLALPPYSHRSFRRMFITRAIENGVDVKVIAQWQGHRDGGKLILDTYSHVNRVHSQRIGKTDHRRRTAERSVSGDGGALKAVGEQWWEWRRHILETAGPSGSPAAGVASL